MRPLIVGNWKMFGLRAALAEITRLDTRLGADPQAADVILCPPATLLQAASALGAARVTLGAQDCHYAPEGPFTGDISAEMAAEAGARYVIVGHSERRHGHGETSAEVCGKARGAKRAGLTPIICVGEAKPDRDAGRALSVLEEQAHASIPPEFSAADFVLAYEPKWAIGTGVVPTDAEIIEAHLFLREKICATRARTPILYGGSVKPANAGGLIGLAEVDGVLVGGASLKADDFFEIIKAGAHAKAGV